MSIIFIAVNILSFGGSVILFICSYWGSVKVNDRKVNDKYDLITFHCLILKTFIEKSTMCYLVYKEGKVYEMFPSPQELSISLS